MYVFLRHAIVCLYIIILLIILGQSILSGQFNNLTTSLSEVNTTLIPDEYTNVLTEFIMSENMTVVNDLANISSNGLCSSKAAQIRDILTTFTSLEIFCTDCG